MKTTQEMWGTDPDQGLIDDFVRCVKEDLPSPVTGMDGLRAMEVGLAAYRSSEKQQPVLLGFQK